jgi:hypothetical protein
VVSTLVFETDILSISEYREPGFEPQYDLSFCLLAVGLNFLGVHRSTYEKGDEQSVASC